jgi:hypothetical protein
VTAPPPDEPDGSSDPRDPRGLDFDAEFERLVADWEPPEPDTAVEPVETSGPLVDPGHPSVGAADRDDNLRNLFRGAWPEEPPPGGDEPEEHFVPPPAPPIPRPEPRRLIAWAGLVGAPLIALVLLVVAALPSWASFLLFCWFVGGFAYLVATMRSSAGDGWDDGAQV